MKKSFVLLAFLVGGVTAWGQKSPLSAAPAWNNSFLHMSASDALGVSERTATCQDTLRYPLVKQATMGGTTGYNLFDLWQADNEAISQAFTLSGSSITISGIEFYGMNGYDATTNPVTGTPSVTVRAAIHAVDANNNPTTLLASGTKVITSTTAGFHYVTFASPITVSSNYAVVIDVESAGGVYTTYVNAAAPNQTYDEDFSRMKSTFYTTSSGAFVSVPTFTSGLTGGPYNFEPVVAPIVSYSITGTATAAPNPACFGTPVTFTGATTPAGVVNNRMFNYNLFSDYFNLAQSDSTYAWVMGAGLPVVWDDVHNYTYATAGSKTPQFYTLTGFVSSCIETTNTLVTITALPTVSAGSDVSICTGASATLTASGALTYVWDNAAGATEVVSVSPTSTTTYTVTGTAASGCSNTDQVVVTVSPLVDASFTYPSNTVCVGSANVIPSAAVGTFSSSNGLVINPTTGEIDVAASTVGSYVITHTVNGTCPNAATQNFTITTSPDATFAYAAPSYCETAVDPSPTFSGTASAGSFTATPAGLLISSVDGTIDLSESAPGTYTVTNSIAASGTCAAASGSQTITIFATPVVTLANLPELCEGASAITLTQGSPAGGVYSGAGVTGNSFDPTGLASGTVVTYAYTDGNGCAGSASAPITIATPTAVTVTPVAALCATDQAVTLEASPAGGVFAGSGVSGSTFTPAIAGAGSHVVTYTYTNSAGCISTEEITIEVDGCLSVDEQAWASLQAFPNPFEGTIYVTGNFGKQLIRDVQLYSLDGKLQGIRYNLEDGSIKVSVDAVAVGVYFLRVQSELGQTTFRIEKR